MRCIDFLDAIVYPQRENTNPKLLLNVTSHVFLTNEAKDRLLKFLRENEIPHMFNVCKFIFCNEGKRCNTDLTARPEWPNLY